MKKVLIVISILIGMTVTNCTGDNNKSQQKAGTNSKTERKAVWMTFDEGLAKAKAEKKNMIVDFYTNWCHWCKVMDEKTFQEQNVNKKLVERFITVRINAEDETETATFKGTTYNNIELTRAFNVRGYPALAFIDTDGEIITVVPGYVPADKFIYFLDYIDQECYKNQMSFEDFMKKKGDCDKKAEKQ